MDEKIENLLTQMTLEEKVSMLAGADQWATVPIERLGIPAIKTTDGPNGARGSQSSGGPTSACFPVGVALGATWNTDLIERVGMALAEEVKAKGSHILLAPTVNIHRSPLAGRNFECYSEDPYLSARMAVAYIQGLQSQGVGACIKHYVCNDSEFERFTMSSEIGERALREIYLFPFEVAVREAQPWAVMSAYNKINGVWASENPYTLLDILKGEWDFDGIVMSDWYGTNSLDIANGGMDLEMPGPARWMGDKVLTAARMGLVNEDVIDDKVCRLLRTIIRAGAFENPELAPERAVDKPEHRQLVREAAAEAIVLLKNNGNLLPLDLNEVKSIAVIGENAKWAQVHAGGSSKVTPHYIVSPLEGIERRVGDAAKVGFEMGCNIHRQLPLIDANLLTTLDGAQPGLTVEYFDTVEEAVLRNTGLSGEPVHTEVIQELNLTWFGESVAHVDPSGFSVRLSAKFTAPETGAFAFGLTSAGRSRLFIDGIERTSSWAETSPRPGAGEVVEIEMAADQGYDFRVEYSWEGSGHWRAVRLGCLPPSWTGSLDDAVALAARSDVAIVLAGLTYEWESEGFDRPDMELVGEQVELIKQVAAANPNTVVVLNTGSPITMNWLDEVAAVVQAWYPGQEAGNALADVLFGDVNPSGKLPTTFPKRLQDNPAFLNYPGENGQVLYGEGIFVGYRYYEKKDVAPLFPFGFGLSYTTFAYRNLILSATEYGPDDEIRVSVEVENTGSRSGQEIVQVYVRDVESSLVRPEKELKAFAKVRLEPGESQTVAFALGKDALSCYDPAQKRWTVEAGEFEVLVGGSSQDIRQVGRFAFTGEAAPEPGQRTKLHIGLAIQALLDNPAGKAVLEKHIPEVIAAPELSMAVGMSLEQIEGFIPDILTVEKLQAIDDDLAAV